MGRVREGKSRKDAGNGVHLPFPEIIFCLSLGISRELMWSNGVSLLLIEYVWNVEYAREHLQQSEVCVEYRFCKSHGQGLFIDSRSVQL